MIKSIIQDICQYAINNDLCNLSQGGTSLYEINFKEQKNYPIIFVSPSSVNSVGVNVVKYSFTMYYLDRLLKDNSNDIDILNSSNTVLQKLINIIRNFDYVLKVDDNYNITNFSDSSHLADCVAGAYVSLNVAVKNNIGNCDIDVELTNINVSTIIYQIKNITITENGDYNVTYDSEYNALKEVNVNVNIDTDSFYQEGFDKGKTEGYNEGFAEGFDDGKEEQKALLESITITENGNYTNENGYDEVVVNLDLESIYNNGYNEGYVQGETEGYNEGFAEGFDDGKEEQKSLLTSITITENGNFTNENGYNEVIVNVGGDVKPKLPNGITLQGSTFSSVDMSNRNWSNVYDWSEMFADCANLVRIQNFPTNVEMLATARMFYNCTKLTSIPSFDTSNVIDMNNMFYRCQSLTSLDLSLFDTSKVINMENMFSGCSKLTSLDLSLFDTSKVTNMKYMFNNINKITSLDLSSFNTSNVTNMFGMFSNCQSLTSLDVSSFDTSNVTDMPEMFHHCQSLTSLDVSSFDTSKVTNMPYMFYYCQSLTSLDVSSFDTSKVTNMNNMFYRCSSLTSLDLSSFDISNVTDMSYMFCNCYKLQSITFQGKPSTSSLNTSSMFTSAGRDAENPILYYPSEFANDYQKIINALPSKWTAVPY